MRILCCLVLVLSLISCSKPSSDNSLTIGTIAGPETELIETAAQVAKKNGLNIKIIEFNDYNLPNQALEDGSLDANVFQHLPYLKAAKKAHNYNLEAIGRTFVYPMGIYSNKIKSLSSLEDKALVALPDDPSNETRALLLLEKAGLITVNNNPIGGLQDIKTNPKELQFKEINAAQLPRILQDVDIAVINTTYALPAGLSPTGDAIFLEDKDSPYANIIVIRGDSLKRKQLESFVSALNSKEVRLKAKELFGDAAIAAW